MKVAEQIGIALLTAAMLSCKSQAPTPPVAAATQPTPAKPALPKDENVPNCRCQRLSIQSKFVSNPAI